MLTTAGHFLIHIYKGPIYKMAEFQRLGIRKFPKVSKSQTSETRYWKKLSVIRRFLCL